MTCGDLRRDAAGLAALDGTDPEREAAFAHARGCPGCAAALREGERLVSLLEEVEVEAPMSPAALRRAAAPVLDALPPARPERLLPGAAALAILLATVAARFHSAAPGDWATLAAVAVVAVGLAALASRGRWPPVVAVAVSVAVAVAEGGAGPVSPSLGLKCIVTELTAAAFPVVAALAVSRHGAGVGPGTLAAAAAAGALGGQAALAVTCHAPHAMAHLLVFHAGGVLLAAVIGLAAGRVVAGAGRPA